MSQDVEVLNSSAYERRMHTRLVLSAFAALSQETRLDTIRLLARAGAAGMLSGELGAALDIRPNTMSTNLGILAAAGLVRNRREGRTVRYFADFDALRRLAVFLVHECCDTIDGVHTRDEAPTASLLIPAPGAR